MKEQFTRSGRNTVGVGLAGEKRHVVECHVDADAIVLGPGERNRNAETGCDDDRRQSPAAPKGIYHHEKPARKPAKSSGELTQGACWQDPGYRPGVGSRARRQADRRTRG